MVSGLGNRFQSEFELVGFSQKSGDSIMKECRASCGPGVIGEIHIG